MGPRDDGRRLYLHIGAPKTGSTFLQGVLWANRDALRRAGVGVPGLGSFEHYRASKDLRGAPFDPDEPGGDGSGSWDLLTQKIGHHSEPVVVLSDEQLCALTGPALERAVTSLAPREVHVVLVVRELESLLPSYWQEVVKHGGSERYVDWVRAVMRHRQRSFWTMQDIPAVLERWATVVPTHRIHVIAVPPAGSGRDELWTRFASVLGVDPGVAEHLDVQTNRGMGLAQTEVRRRLNGRLPASLERWHYSTLARELLVEDILSGGEGLTPQTLPPRLAALLDDERSRMIAGIGSSGCVFVGSMSDLGSPAQPSPVSLPSDAELLDVAIGGMAGLLVEMARRQEQVRSARSTRLLEFLVRRRSVSRLIAAVEGRSVRLDAMLTDLAGSTRSRVRGGSSG